MSSDQTPPAEPAAAAPTTPAAPEPRPSIPPGRWSIIETPRLNAIREYLNDQKAGEVAELLFMPLRSGGHIAMPQIDAADFFTTITAAQAKWDAENPKPPSTVTP